MLSQRLRHRVTVQQIHADQDSDTGLVTELWTDHLTNEPAEVVPMSGREFVAAATVQAGVNTRITIRRQDGIVPRMRVVHEGIYYDIKAVLPDPTLRRHLTLMCESGVNDG